MERMHGMHSMERTSIALSPATKQRLAAFGAKSESFDAILQRLIGEAERHGFFAEVQRIQAKQSSIRWQDHKDVWDTT
jgi:hypothetical protein